MGGEATITIITRHELPPADRRSPGLARRTRSAGNYGGNDDGSPEPRRSSFSGSHYFSGDFVPQHEREGVASGHTIKREADVCVAHAAARDLHDNLIGTGAESGKLTKLQRRLRGRQSVSVCALYARRSASWLAACRKDYTL